jgi:ferritin
MLSQKVQDAINNQINAELFSSYLYLSMSNYFESLNLSGMAHWMKAQAEEEKIHAEKFMNFVNEAGGRVILAAIDAPQTEWESPLSVFEDALGHEKKITGMINELVDIAQTDKNHAANNLLQWFIDEQVEEEASADDIVQKLKLVGDNGTGVFMIDNELGTRPLPTPAAPAE